MKEYQSTTGGRHAYNTDFKNLQELALAMQEVFRECGENFVISGCAVTVGGTVSVTDGYVYIDGKVRKVSATSGLKASNLHIVSKQRNGDQIPYADKTVSPQYIEYYAEVVNESPVSGPHITYDASSKSFPNLATAFFNFYTVCKKAGAQSINNLTVQQTLIAMKQLLAPQGVQFDNASMCIKRNGNKVVIGNGDYELGFSNDGEVSISCLGKPVLTFSALSGSGVVTYENVTVKESLKTKKLYIGGIDIEDKVTPLGVVQMWAGKVEKIPQNYMLCNGQELDIKSYKDLYNVLGDAFNNAVMPSGKKWPSPSNGSFRLPDLRQRFITGYDPSSQQYGTIGNAGGEERHTLSASEMPPHAHNVDDYYNIQGEDIVVKYGEEQGKLYGSHKNIGGMFLGSGNYDFNNDAIMYKTHPSASYGGGGAHENRPPFYALAYIIKVK